MLTALRYYWITAKGYRLRPWASPYIRWRLETFLGGDMHALGPAEFFRLIWRERKPPVRALNRELARWMLDRRVLTEDNLIVRAHKSLAQETPREIVTDRSSAVAANEGRFGPRSGA